ncbi:folate-binding protein YgfZ [Candidatus Pseudothioglobus singularis]|nr:folate-binding protein YgfZ [Candidatus Pseudothioglobus singularis]MDB4599017.1 folate-binding protein YgfZ [Candidatus Pseudothioglobus singularis]
MKIHLKNRSLLKISGKDAEEFLQNQLSNDIEKIDSNKVQFNAYCQHQGKVIAFFWVMRMGEDFLLSFPGELLEKIENRLKIFVIMSDVIIENVTNVLSQTGLINESSPNESSPNEFRINDELAVVIEDSNGQSVELAENHISWEKAYLDSHLPEIYNVTSEKLVPQMLNLDINELGVSFSKGCYPGQEVVARLHYLGSAKRRLFSFKADQEMQVGDSLYCATSKTALARGDRYKGSGIVVSKVKYSSLFYCLATLDVDLIDEEITINNEYGHKLQRINDE